MIPPEDDLLAAALRRALHESADSFEPGDDGLDRIRRELLTVGPRRAERRLRAAGTRAGWLIRVWAGPLADWARSATASAAARAPALGPWWLRAAAAWTWIAGAVAGAAAGRARLPRAGAPSTRRHSPAHAMPPTPGNRRAAQLAWLRATVAVAGAAVLISAGAYALAQLRQTVITQFTGDSSTAVSPPVSRSPSPRPGSPAPSQSAPAPAPQPSAPRRARHHATPRPSCSPGPSATPSASPTTSPSASPSPSLTPSSSPTPSPGASSAGGPTASPAATGAAIRGASAKAARSKC